MFADTFPCALLLFGATILILGLFIAYLWRCWILFFCFNLAEAQKHYKEDANFKNFFLLNRHRIKTEYLSKNLGSLLVILVFPVAWWVAHTDRTVFDPLNQGDNCEGDIVFGLLGVYTMIFACIFSYLAYNLVGSMDNFGIKEELKITAVIGVLTFIPWILFNVQSDMANVNAVSILSQVICKILCLFRMSFPSPRFVSILRPWLHFICRQSRQCANPLKRKR